MDDLKKYLNAAYNLLTNVSVKGADVERMARVFAWLRKAYAECDTEKGDESNGG